MKHFLLTVDVRAKTPMFRGISTTKHDTFSNSPQLMLISERPSLDHKINSIKGISNTSESPMMTAEVWNFRSKLPVLVTIFSTQAP